MFRAVVNTDKCMNLDAYEFLLYQSCSQRKMLLISDSTTGDYTKLRNDVANICVCFKDNQHDTRRSEIVFLLDAHGSNDHKWKDAFLYKVLTALRAVEDLELCGINRINRSVITMLGFFGNEELFTNQNSRYVDSKQFESEVADFCAHFGIEPEERQNISTTTLEKLSEEELPGSFITFVKREIDVEMNENDEEDQVEDNNISPRNTATLGGLLRLYLQNSMDTRWCFIREVICNREDQDSANLEMIRIVEYITSDDRNQHELNLLQFCIDSWNRANDSSHAAITALKRKYGEALYDYEERLRRYINEYADSHEQYEELVQFPKVTASIPSEFAIMLAEESPREDVKQLKRDRNETVDDKVRQSNVIQEQKNDITEIINEFSESVSNMKHENAKRRTNAQLPEKDSVTISTIRSKWESAYLDLTDIADRANDALIDCEKRLGQRYTDVLSEREAEMHQRAQTRYSCDELDELQSELEKERERVVLDLKNSDMTPVLVFQESLNYKSALNESNRKIIHSINCLQAISSFQFRLLLRILLSLIAVFYLVLQPYNLLSLNTVALALGYICLVAVIMRSAWSAPLKYYSSQIREELYKLRENSRSCMDKYNQKVERIQKYVNLMNKLDYLDKSIELVKRTDDEYKYRDDVRVWYIEQAKKHIERVETYHKSILCEGPEAGELDEQSIPEISAVPQSVIDIRDSELFWPKIRM